MPFTYDDLVGTIKILNYEKAIPYGSITLQYNDNVITTTTPNLLHLKIPSLFNREKTSKKYKYNIGDIIEKFNDRLEILEQIKITYDNSACRGYKVKCIDCGYIYETREDTMSSCPICGKRTSFGERCIFKLLQLNNIDFIPQIEFEWLQNKFYDCYLPSKNTIIEVNGLQHYQPVKMNSHETPEETFSNTLKSDILKYDSAISNNINIIYINSSNHNYTAKFSKEFYENTVQALSNLIPYITYEIWIECEKFANYKFMRNECELRNKGLSIEEISKELNEKQDSVIAKLRMGDKYKMCTYDKNVNYKLGRQKSIAKRVS